MTKAEYNRAYYKANGEKIRLQAKEYRQAHQEQIRQYDRERYPARREMDLARLKANYDPVGKAAYNKDYFKSHRQQIRQQRHEYRQTHKLEIRERNRQYVKTHRSKANQWQKRWNAKNRHKLREMESRRRALEVADQSQVPLLQKVYERARSRKRLNCYYCGQKISGVPHVDHVIALSVGGNHATENVTISCEHCNKSKGVKSLSTWAPNSQPLLNF